MLKIINLVKSFGNKIVLNKINIEINDGTIFGLVGVNGAGKSTLLRCIAGVYSPDEGGCNLDNDNTGLYPQIRKDIVFVSDDVYYPSNANIASMKNLYSCFYDLDEEKYNYYLKLFDLDDKKMISSFSKGMKRQASLLFALAIKPRLLLLDECFDGLDPVVRLNFKKALVELLEEQKSTVIISSHNLKELEDICDSYGILENGNINTYGDLLDSKNNICKFQIVYDDEKNIEEFKDINAISCTKEGRIITLVVKDDLDKARQIIKESNPILVDEIPVSFEEMFIYEVESRGLLNEQ